MRSSSRVLLVTLGLALATTTAAVAGPPAPAPPTAVSAAAAAPPAFVHPRLSPLLNQLVGARLWGDGEWQRRLAVQLERDEQVKVVVETLPGRAAEAEEQIVAAGGLVTARHGGLRFATVPIAALPVVADGAAVLRVRTPLRSRPEAVSEGLAVHGASTLHGQGVTGAGVKVGILDCGGFSGYASLLGTDLPATVTLWGGGADPVGGDAHGTACAEIVHDMAPGAQLYLAHDGEEVDFYSAVDWMLAQGVKVISYSCCWLGDFPLDGSALPYNPITAKVEEARADGVLWVNSAGNYGDGDSYGAAYLQFEDRDWHSFDGEWSNGCYLRAGSSYYFALTWNDWPADPTSQGSSQDYNMELWRWDGAAWTIPVSSNNAQNGGVGQLPFEEISFSPTVDDWYYLTVARAAATTTCDLSLRSFGPGFLHWQAGPSIATPADSPDALAVAAVHWSSLDLEPFSSRGPALGPGGALAGGARKPDLTGADAVSTVTFGDSDGVAWWEGEGFFGTSASCPHVAGGAALLCQRFPQLKADELEALLLGGAEDRGTPGPDIDYGSGLMRLGSIVFGSGVEAGSTTGWSAAVP